MAMTEPAYHGFDPQASYSQPQFELLRCCLVRTLMTYRGVPNFEGTQPVPDLATGPPSVSTDGKTWTFHLRPGIHYAPPLQDVTVTSGDIVRALLRAGSGQVNGGPGIAYLGSIEGFDEYVDGRAATIAGVSTPDDLTLQVHQIRSDRSIEHLFAMAFTSPIPALPNDPDAALGVATGHPFSSTFEGGPPKAEGYGPFLVSTGPYMIEGSESLDLTVPPGEQTPTSGFTPGWWFDDPGSIVLVRNPSWDPATDPNRPALPDRIEIAISPAENPYPLLEDGEIDLVMSENPPPPLLRRVPEGSRAPGSHRDHSRKRHRLLGDERRGTAVRRCPRSSSGRVGRRSRVDGAVRQVDRIASDPRPDGRWTADGVESLPHHARYRRYRCSPYGDGQVAVRGERSMRRRLLCTQSSDRLTRVLTSRSRRSSRPWRRSGSRAEFRDSACFDPREHIGICDTGWFADFPDAGNMIVPFLATEDGFDPSHLGASREQLRQWGYTKVKRVPSIQIDYERCATLAGVEAAMCWARIDQLLTGELVVAVPISSADVIRLRSGDISGFAIDQAFGEPALDRISVDG